MSFSYFIVRDRLDHLLLGPAAFEAPQVSLALLRVLLEHTWYTSDQLGYVNRKVTGLKTLAKLMCVSDRTMMRALAELENAGYIERIRHDEGQKRCPDDIYMTVLEVWFPVQMGTGEPDK